MDAQLESLLSQHGLQQAIEPLIKVGVDSHVALGYVDQEVIASMRRDHGLPLVTSKMLQDKMPALLNFASNDTLRSVSQAQVRHILPISPSSSSITGAECAKPLHSQPTSISTRDASDQAALISGASAAEQSSCEQVALISGASAAEQSSCEQVASLLEASAAEQSSGEQDALISGASAAVQSSGEQDASILEASAAVPSSREQTASILRRWPNPLLGKRPSLVPSTYRKESKTANVASLHPNGRITNRFQCPKCLRWYRFNHPQTFNANKARHMKACKGQNDLSTGFTEANWKAHKYKDAMPKRKAGKHTDAVARPVRVKRSAQVVNASKSSALTGSEVAHGPDEPNLMAVASSILNFSQKAYQSSLLDSAAGMDLPDHIEESVASFSVNFYTTEHENENCVSIARKFGLNAQKIFTLNQKRYRGFKTANTKLKACLLYTSPSPRDQ